MNIKFEINLDNDAFDSNWPNEADFVLERLKRAINKATDPEGMDIFPRRTQIVQDSNGNTIGHIAVEDS